MKRALQNKGSSSTVTKKSKTEKHRKGAPTDSFACSFCLREIARAEDLLGMFGAEMQTNAIVGFFRNVFNVGREHSADPGPVQNVFASNVFCLQCFAILGSLIVRGDNSVAGNYVIIMNFVRFRRGILVADAITREVLGFI